MANPAYQDASASESGPAAPRRGVFGGGAWRVGRIAGIEVNVDYTWVLIFFLVTLSLGTQLRLAHESWSWPSTWGGAFFTSLLFFASILLHELGHSLVAQRLGVRVRSITLFVFGGMAALEGEPRRPRDEILIAAAGPLVSVALGVFFGACSGALAGSSGLGEVVGASMAWLGRINLIVAAFNVVPGFPLDGGRVLRGVLWAMWGSFERATAAAATTGAFFAWSLIGLGAFAAIFAGQLLGGLWLAFIGWFLLTAARATVGQMVLERVLGSVRAMDAMESVEGQLVSGGQSVAELVAEAVLRRGRRTFYVVDRDGRLEGLVTLAELARVPAEERGHRRVDEVMVATDRLVVLGAYEDGWTAFKRMAERNVNQLPVVESGRLLGAVTRERLIALVQANLALAPAPARG